MESKESATNSPSPIQPFRTRWRNEQRVEVETDRGLFAGVHCRRRSGRVRDHDNGSPIYVRAASARVCRPNHEESFALATKVDRRTDDENFADRRKDRRTAGRNSWRYWKTCPRRHRRIASRDLAISHARAATASETNGRTPATLDAAPRHATRERSVLCFTSGNARLGLAWTLAILRRRSRARE